MAVTPVQIKTTSSTNNLYRVPAKQWNRWSAVARRVFNETYSAMVGDQDMFLHPKAQPLPETQWKTTAWNAAWIAALAV